MTRILLVHNYYRERGGEDAVFEAERDLLSSHRHDVHAWTVESGSVIHSGGPGVAIRALWSRDTTRELRKIIEKNRPDVVHFHNTFPLISPSAYYACRDAHVPVVQTLHNYRLACPGAPLYRDGAVCEECLGRRFAFPGVRHGCYHESRIETAAVATLFAAHRGLHTWSRTVDLYITPTDFTRQKLAQAGVPLDKIHVKPHFVSPDLGPGDHSGGYALYVGRLSEEKGVQTLLDAWERHAIDLPLVIIGDGPLRTAVSEAAHRQPSITWLGSRPASEVADRLGEAALLVCPSLCYETFGRVIAEAFARGTPVIGSAHGAIGELITDGETGYLFQPGNAASLAAAVATCREAPTRLVAMRALCRETFEARYSAEANYHRLMDLYRMVMDC